MLKNNNPKTPQASQLHKNKTTYMEKEADIKNITNNPESNNKISENKIKNNI